MIKIKEINTIKSNYNINCKQTDGNARSQLTRRIIYYVDILTLHRDDCDQPVGPFLECLAEKLMNDR